MNLGALVRLRSFLLLLTSHHSFWMCADGGGVGGKGVFIHPEQPAAFSGSQPSMPLDPYDNHSAFYCPEGSLEHINYLNLIKI